MDLKLLSESSKPVLILGETGVGKSTLARKIHKYSKRQTYIQLNISSLNSSLIESELFGHRKGAFTGAINDSKGYFEEIGDGTLFIDEIGELSLELQAKLLSVFDEKIFYKVGSTAPKIFKGRLIFATNKNLSDEVRKGRFRADLYFRIRFFELHRPPLRKNQDLLKIILDMTYDLSFKYKRQIKYDSEVLHLFSQHLWPGNYRELMQTIEYLFILSKPLISKPDLPHWIQESANNSTGVLSSNYNDALSSFERDYLTQVMIQNQGKINKTAISIGMSKVTLISKLKKYDIDRRIFHNLKEKEITYGF